MQEPMQIRKLKTCSPLPLFVFAEKFFHVCKQCSCTAADRARRWADSRGTKRPKYLKG